MTNVLPLSLGPHPFPRDFNERPFELPVPRSHSRFNPPYETPTSPTLDANRPSARPFHPRQPMDTPTPGSVIDLPYPTCTHFGGSRRTRRPSVQTSDPLDGPAPSGRTSDHVVLGSRLSP